MYCIYMFGGIGSVLCREVSFVERMSLYRRVILYSYIIGSTVHVSHCYSNNRYLEPLKSVVLLAVKQVIGDL